MFDDAIALLKGFWTTVKYTARPAVTIQYPDVKRTPADKYPRPAPALHATTTAWSAASAVAVRGGLPVAGDLRAAPPRTTRPTRSRPASASPPIYEINMIRCIFCGYCEEACPVDAIKLGPEYELADFNRKDFVYTKEMLLDPAKYAPKLQYHADVDRSTDSRGVHTTLDDVYRTHHPIGAPDTRLPHGDAHGPSDSAAPRSTSTALRSRSDRAPLPGPCGQGRLPPTRSAQLNELFVPLAVGCAVALVSALCVVAGAAAGPCRRRAAGSQPVDRRAVPHPRRRHGRRWARSSSTRAPSSSSSSLSSRCCPQGGREPIADHWPRPRRRSWRAAALLARIAAWLSLGRALPPTRRDCRRRTSSSLAARCSAALIVPFELTAPLLLVAIVGAVSIWRRQERMPMSSETLVLGTSAVLLAIGADRGAGRAATRSPC